MPGPAATALYTLSLHDALPICRVVVGSWALKDPSLATEGCREARLFVRPHELEVKPLRNGEPGLPAHVTRRSEEHTSELQSRPHLVCRLLLEKKKGPTRARRSS